VAGFKTHITTSSVLGVAYGGAGALLLRDANGEIPIATCMLGAGLCSIAGMLPDLDSDTGVPLRETVAFTAAVVPLLLMDRFSQLGFSSEALVVAGATVYLLIRFGFLKLLKRYTVHRGMFHSIPAALIAAEIGFLLCSGETLSQRYFKGGAVLLGFMSHLILDEIYSIDFRHLRLKSSFGTAIKFWGPSSFANLLTYAFVLSFALIVWKDPSLVDSVESQIQQGKSVPRIAIDEIKTLFR
jgi:membrane-bound metal-dependent hydrolase YbcI (DUF457 family)